MFSYKQAGLPCDGSSMKFDPTLPTGSRVGMTQHTKAQGKGKKCIGRNLCLICIDYFCSEHNRSDKYSPSCVRDAQRNVNMQVSVIVRIVSRASPVAVLDLFHANRQTDIHALLQLFIY
jgi:hypothetical protein